MRDIEYITIDFETANSSLTSACSLGVVIARCGFIIEEKHYYINPNEAFSLNNIAIHGITYEDCKDQKTFDLIWNELFDIFDNNIIFAHNEAFDFSVLFSLIKKYNLNVPNIKTGCTLKLSKIIYKDTLPNHKLSTISHHLEVEHNHHDALSDARVCFYIIERAKRIYQVYDTVDLFETLSLGFGTMNPKFRRGCYKIESRINTGKVETNLLEGKIIAFTGKPKSKTKNEIKNLIIAHGGKYSRLINLGLTTFIIFPSPLKSSLSILSLLQEKKEIEILDEESFLNLINGK